MHNLNECRDSFRFNKSPYLKGIHPEQAQEDHTVNNYTFLKEIKLIHMYKQFLNLHTFDKSKEFLVSQKGNKLKLYCSFLNLSYKRCFIVLKVK